MEFVVNKREFVKALSRVQSVADKKSPMPILSNVLIVADTVGRGAPRGHRPDSSR
jgi:DNA polymerase III sliding clamp (beta) subunit (PCNA family)